LRQFFPQHLNHGTGYREQRTRRRPAYRHWSAGKRGRAVDPRRALLSGLPWNRARRANAQEFHRPRAQYSIDGAFWVCSKFGHNRRLWGLRRPKAKPLTLPPRNLPPNVTYSTIPLKVAGTQREGNPLLAYEVERPARAKPKTNPRKGEPRR
jgi:hypothetical protein